jgi:hypothetical protein
VGAVTVKVVELTFTRFDTIEVFIVFMYRNDAFWFRLTELNVAVGAVTDKAVELTFTRFDTIEVFTVFM